MFLMTKIIQLRDLEKELEKEEKRKKLEEKMAGSHGIYSISSQGYPATQGIHSLVDNSWGGITEGGQKRISSVFSAI
jgi:hypothetical protein